MALTDKLTAIGDRIRERLGESELIPLADMPDKIDEVSDKGKQAEYDRFWDDFQQNGNRTNYSFSFGSGWNANNFRPKYPIRPTNAYMMFYTNSADYITTPDFVEFCNKHNIILDFSNCTSAHSALGRIHANHFGVLDFSKCTILNALFYSHNTGTGVKTIDKFISSEATTYSTTTFQNATFLENITVEGVIAKNYFDVSYCTKLTHESLMSIINCLKDFSGDGTTHTVTLGTANLAKLTDGEKAIATQKGWTLV